MTRDMGSDYRDGQFVEGPLEECVHGFDELT